MDGSSHCTMTSLVVCTLLLQWAIGLSVWAVGPELSRSQWLSDVIMTMAAEHNTRQVVLHTCWHSGTPTYTIQGSFLVTLSTLQGLQPSQIRQSEGNKCKSFENCYNCSLYRTVQHTKRPGGRGGELKGG